MTKAIRKNIIKRFEEDMVVLEDFDIYSGEGRNELLENEMIDPIEEAFMRGYDEDNIL